MATRTVFIHNNDTNEIESYTLDTSDPMPYNEGNTLTVGEMQSDTSISSVIISDKMTMEAWNCFRQIYGNPIYVPYAFKRIWEGGHSNTSQHYAGKAFDVG